MGVDQHDLPARPARQRPRLLIDRIAELLDRAANSLPRFRPHVRAIVQHARNGDARDARGLGDIIDGRICASSRAQIGERLQRFATAELACQRWMHDS